MIYSNYRWFSPIDQLTVCSVCVSYNAYLHDKHYYTLWVMCVGSLIISNYPLWRSKLSLSLSLSLSRVWILCEFYKR